MKRNRVSRGPQARLRLHVLIGTEWILREQGLCHGDEIDRCLLPALGEAAMPERKVAQRLDPPGIGLADKVVLVETAFPPGAWIALRALVQAGLHHRSAAHLGGFPIRR